MKEKTLQKYHFTNFLGYHWTHRSIQSKAIGYIEIKWKTTAQWECIASSDNVCDMITRQRIASYTAKWVVHLFYVKVESVACKWTSFNRYLIIDSISVTKDRHFIGTWILIWPFSPEKISWRPININKTLKQLGLNTKFGRCWCMLHAYYMKFIWKFIFIGRRLPSTMLSLMVFLNAIFEYMLCVSSLCVCLCVCI